MYESTPYGILFIYTHLCRIHQSKRSRTCGSAAGCHLLVSPTVARGRRAHKSGLQSDRAPGSTAHLPYSKQRVKFMKLSLSHTAVGGHQTVLQTVLNTTGFILWGQLFSMRRRELQPWGWYTTDSATPSLSVCHTI